jgi:nitrite reductase/ring-hydroxylating ferredoxin subunit
MTTTIEGAELTRIGSGTVMGDLMRQYWLPAMLSSELAPNGAPIRLMLLGEKLIAFRDSAGLVGVMDHRCAHRCASLFLGRNEEGGIRCVYHGWKYDVAGNCIDMPSLPPHHDFRRKVRAMAYQVVERCGLVWVYMGARTEAPQLPALEILNVPNEEIGVTIRGRTRPLRPRQPRAMRSQQDRTLHLRTCPRRTTPLIGSRVIRRTASEAGWAPRAVRYPTRSSPVFYS